jgi:hypothetical protein
LALRPLLQLARFCNLPHFGAPAALMNCTLEENDVASLRFSVAQSRRPDRGTFTVRCHGRLGSAPRAHTLPEVELRQFRQTAAISNLGLP